jgi:hypothetical protein
MDIVVKRWNTEYKFRHVEFPSHMERETVAEHTVKLGRKGNVRREIHVGAEPWGLEGERQGTSCKGRVVAKIDERGGVNTAAFDRLLFDMALEVVQGADEGSPEQRSAGKIVFAMKEHNIVPPPVPVICPRCTREYNANLCRSSFGEAALFLWVTNEGGHDPMKMSTTVCLDCLNGVKTALESKKAEAEKVSRMDVDEFMLSGKEPENFTGVGTSWDHAIEKVKARIGELRGKA